MDEKEYLIMKAVLMAASGLLFVCIWAAVGLVVVIVLRSLGVL